MKATTISLAVFGALLALFLVMGCSSGGSEETLRTGKATLTIKWPAPDRLIPQACNSIKVTLDDGDGFTESRVVNRPEGDTTTETFVELPVGMMDVTATAYPQANAQGVAQATGMAQLEITAGNTATVTLTMGSTIDRIEVNAQEAMQAGTNQQCTITAYNASGEVVLVAPSVINWTSSNPAAASINGSGLLTANDDGVTTVTATDTESGKSATKDVTVTAISVMVDPYLASVSVTKQQQFTATVTGTSNTAVVWSLYEKSSTRTFNMYSKNTRSYLGDIDENGLYTAPAAGGFDVGVVATSVADPSKSGEATVSITSGTGDVIIQ